ncbi:MAG: flavin reductase family protein, partial [Runella sp.]
MRTFNPQEISTPELHHLLQGCIAPRPIAFASTITPDGHVNLSPFSFFNLFGTRPPTLIFSPNRRVRDNTEKHTL